MSQQMMMSKPSGELHVLINTLTNCVPADGFAHFTPEHKKEMERLKKEKSKIVEAEYLNSRGKQERLTKPYCAGSGDPIQIWHLIPGKKYKLPLGFIHEVNDQNKFIPKRSGLVSIDGNELRKDGAPIDKDEEGEWLHKLIPVGF
jgi:hypothetical protein